MKKIKIKTSIIGIEEVEDGIKVNYLDRKTKSQDEIFLPVHHCLLCQKVSFVVNHNNICPRCEILVDEYKKKEHFEQLLEKPIRKQRKSKVVLHYNKSKLANKDITVENITELHNLITTSMTKEKLEMLIRFAISGFTYEKIANILNVRVSSVIRDYGFLMRAGICTRDNDRAKITNIVRYQLPQTIQTHYKVNVYDQKRVAIILAKYGKYFETWTSKKELLEKTNLKPTSISKYMSVLLSNNMLEKRGDHNHREYRLKSIVA